jgi:hypothetical protein
MYARYGTAWSSAPRAAADAVRENDVVPVYMLTDADDFRSVLVPMES